MNFMYASEKGIEAIHIVLKNCADCKHYVGTDEDQGVDVILCGNYEKAAELDSLGTEPFKMIEYLQEKNVALIEPYELEIECKLFEEKE